MERRHTDRDYGELVTAAIEALETSNPKQDPDHRFGAAVLTKAGSVYASAVYWSDTGTLTLHAEQGALAHAAAHGEREIVAIATVSTENADRKAKCHPCGVCKQVIYESARDSGIDADVVMAGLDGAYTVEAISALTPYPWP